MFLRMNQSKLEQGPWSRLSDLNTMEVFLGSPTLLSPEMDGIKRPAELARRTIAQSLCRGGMERRKRKGNKGIRIERKESGQV